jgi:signal transduction histidine kinase
MAPEHQSSHARSDNQETPGAAAPRTVDPTSIPLAVYEAALVVASELDLEGVLQRIVDLARTVANARYGALGVSDQDGRILQFITSGISQEQRAAIGDLPQGHGMLGALIRDRTPMLVPDIASDRRSVGFPPNHPPMRSLLGTPVLLGDRVLGDIYLTDRLDSQPFDEDDLAAVQLLAAHAATAIERAQLYQQVQESRVRAEEQRDQLRSILDNLPTAIVIQAPPDGRIELANAAAIDLIFGSRFPSGSLPSYDRDYRFLNADGTPIATTQRPDLRALRGDLIRSRQFQIERWDGTRLPVLVHAAPLRNARGQITQAVVVCQDITRLREAEQLKDDFISLVSHEMRTPLTSIHGGARLLADQRDALDEETQHDLLKDIVVESDRLERMLSNMLSLTAILAGRLEANTEPVLIAPLARKVVTEVAARSPRHDFAIDLPENTPPIEADPELISQVLRNLYENAVKYSPNGGVIRTSASRDGDRVQIQVSDQGIGIAPEHVPHVFERFRRPGADPTVRGMGLGLYLSRSLIEAQDGEIAASSPGPGQGATFAITLPVAAGWAEESESQQMNEVPSQLTGQEKDD